MHRPTLVAELDRQNIAKLGLTPLPHCWALTRRLAPAAGRIREFPILGSSPESRSGPSPVPFTQT